MNILLNIFDSIFNRISMILMPLILLVMRLWMANIFWKSGLTKIDNWEQAVGLFKDIYKVPFISPELAAYSSTAIELACPVLLVVGLFTRLATIPMLCMIVVIQYTFPDSFQDHFYWAILLGTLLCNGAGAISLDRLLSKKFF